MGWNKITDDLASAGSGGWRVHRPDGGAGLLIIEYAYVLDATLDDAIVTLPPAAENAGRMAWAKRVDSPGTIFVAEVVPYSTLDTIQGDASYPLASQWASVLLVAIEANEWLVMAEIL